MLVCVFPTSHPIRHLLFQTLKPFFFPTGRGLVIVLRFSPGGILAETLKKKKKNWRLKVEFLTTAEDERSVCVSGGWWKRSLRVGEGRRLKLCRQSPRPGSRGEGARVGGAIAISLWGRLGLIFQMKRGGGTRMLRNHESQEGRHQARKLLTTHSHDQKSIVLMDHPGWI